MINVVGIIGQNLAEQVAASLIVRSLEAAQQLIQSFEHLLGKLCRDNILILAAVGEDCR